VPQKLLEVRRKRAPSQQIISSRRLAELVISKPRKRNRAAIQGDLLFDKGKGSTNEDQQYVNTAVINAVRKEAAEYQKLAEIRAIGWL
jgi:hypothetical protein